MGTKHAPLLCEALKEMGHPQPEDGTPIQMDNSTGEGTANDRAKQQSFIRCKTEQNKNSFTSVGNLAVTTLGIIMPNITHQAIIVKNNPDTLTPPQQVPNAHKKLTCQGHSKGRTVDPPKHQTRARAFRVSLRDKRQLLQLSTRRQQMTSFALEKTHAHTETLRHMSEARHLSLSPQLISLFVLRHGNRPPK